MLAAAKGLPLTAEAVPLPRALARTLAKDVVAEEDIPAFTRSTVDGYAVRAADTAGAGESIPAFLALAGRVEMGEETPLELAAGACAYVPTGAMLPQGADAVVMVEHCEPFGPDSVAIYEPVSPGRNVIQRGDDARRGEAVLRAGTRIRAQEIGVLAANGITQVPIYAPLRMAIFSTGDELVPPEKPPQTGQVRDVNTAALAAQAQAAGYRVTTTQVLRDEESFIEGAVRSAMAENDIVMLSGGSSQGEKDATARIIGRVASRGVLTHGLALKPGKPTIVGYDDPSRTLFIGLPGHPVSAMMVFEGLLSWLWRQLTVPAESARDFLIEATLERNVPSSPGKETLQLVALREDGGRYLAVPVHGQSGLITRLSMADGYIRIGHNQEGLTKGQPVRVHLL